MSETASFFYISQHVIGPPIIYKEGIFSLLFNVKGGKYYQIIFPSFMHISYFLPTVAKMCARQTSLLTKHNNATWVCLSLLISQCRLN